MCFSKDCFRLSGFFLGFMWMVGAIYYTMETIEILKLMKLQCGKVGEPSGRIQFDDEIIRQVCDFYAQLDVFAPYHVITTVIKMVPGFLLVMGIFTNNRTLVEVFAIYAFLEEVFFIIVFAKIFAHLAVAAKTAWMYWMLVLCSLKVIICIWVMLGVYAAISTRAPVRVERQRY